MQRKASGVAGVITRAATSDDMAVVARLCWSYRDHLIERSQDLPPIVETYYAREHYQALIADLPRIHARPQGDILIATYANQAVGCAMYYPLSDDVCEIKRVYVDAGARGLGAGQALMQLGLERAKEDGYKRMVLDTFETLVEAIALYERIGFAPCAPFYEPDPDFAPLLRFFDIQL